MNKHRLLTLMGSPRRLVPYIYPTYGTELAPAAAATTPISDVDATTGWIKSATSTISSVATPRTGSSGSYALNEVAGVNAQELIRVASIPTVAGDFIFWDSWIKTIDAATIVLYDNSNLSLLFAYSAFADWTRIKTTLHIGGGDKHVDYKVLQAGGNFLVDDVSIKKVTFSTMLANRKSCTPGNVIAGVNITVPNYVTGGLMINLDSMENPQNGVALWINLLSTKNIWLKKLVAGVWTTVANGFVTLVPGGLLQIRNSGTDYEMWYNGAQVGTTQTISDAFTGTNSCQLASSSEVVFS